MGHEYELVVVQRVVASVEGVDVTREVELAPGHSPQDNDPSVREFLDHVVGAYVLDVVSVEGHLVLAPLHLAHDEQAMASAPLGAWQEGREGIARVGVVEPQEKGFLHLKATHDLKPLASHMYWPPALMHSRTVLAPALVASLAQDMAKTTMIVAHTMAVTLTKGVMVPP